MSLQDKIQTDLATAMKAGDKPAVKTLRFLLSQIKSAALSQTNDFKDEDVLKIIRNQIKKGQESLEMFTKANRNELVGETKAEIELMSQYLPQQLSEDEVRTKLKEVLAQAPEGLEGGGLVGFAIKQFQGKADNGLVARLVKEING